MMFSFCNLLVHKAPVCVHTICDSLFKGNLPSCVLYEFYM